MKFFQHFLSHGTTKWYLHLYVIFANSHFFLLWIYCFVGIYYCYTRYEDLEGVKDSDLSITEVEFSTNADTYLALKQTWLIFIGIMGVLLAIILLVLIFLRTRIKIAIALIEEGSR